MRGDAENDPLTERIIGLAMKVHRALGPGLLESAYEACLLHELSRAGIAAQSQVLLPIRYDGMVIEAGYRIDILVDERVVIELKSVEEVLGVHKAQVITYLKLSGKRTGLLINFNTTLLKDGVHRLWN